MLSHTIGTTAPFTVLMTTQNPSNSLEPFHVSSQTRSPESLNVMVGTAIVLWTATFALVHGPFVFGYLAMHAVSTGLFLLAIRRADRLTESAAAQRRDVTTAGSAIKHRKHDRVASPQPVA